MEPVATVTRDIDLALPPNEPERSARLRGHYELWKADQGAFDQGHHISNAEYLIWMARGECTHLTSEEKSGFR
jgi:hypothetical protein